MCYINVYGNLHSRFSYSMSSGSDRPLTDGSKNDATKSLFNNPNFIDI